MDWDNGDIQTTFEKIDRDVFNEMTLRVENFMAELFDFRAGRFLEHILDHAPQLYPPGEDLPKLCPFSTFRVRSSLDEIGHNEIVQFPEYPSRTLFVEVHIRLDSNEDLYILVRGAQNHIEVPCDMAPHWRRFEVGEFYTSRVWIQGTFLNRLKRSGALNVLFNALFNECEDESYPIASGHPIYRGIQKELTDKVSGVLAGQDEAISPPPAR